MTRLFRDCPSRQIACPFGPVLARLMPLMRHDHQGKGPHKAGLSSCVWVDYSGMMTLSMTWMTPFDASMSAATTVASLTMTPLSRSMVMLLP
jgi:hypothetical protein